MKRPQRINRNHALRFLMAAVILFSALVPPASGFCRCEDCDCSNRLPSAASSNPSAPVPKAPGGCCCKAKENANAPQSQETQQDTESGSPDRKPCDCPCGEPQNTPPTIRNDSADLYRIANELKESSVDPAFPAHAGDIRLENATASFDRLDDPTSRLPVRLHLLLLVLRN